MFEMKGILASVKHKVFKMFRFIGFEEEDSNVCSPAPILTVTPSESANTITNHALEAEFRKAQALMYLRMWENQPK